MKHQGTIAKESQNFFDLKAKLAEEIEKYEKKIYSEKENLLEIENTFNRLSEFLRKNNSEYFQLKLDTLNKLILKTTEKRAYRKIEFDRIFKTLEKIKSSDSVEFLNNALKNRIEKISEKIVRSKHSPLKTENESFYLIKYNSMNFLVKNYPTRILYDVDATKDFVKIKKNRFPLFPKFIKTKKSDNSDALEFCNILILKVRTEYKCLRFDEFETISDLSFSSVKSKLIPLSLPMQEVKHYLRLKGKRVYYLDL